MLTEKDSLTKAIIRTATIVPAVVLELLAIKIMMIAHLWLHYMVLFRVDDCPCKNCKGFTMFRKNQS